MTGLVLEVLMGIPASGKSTWAAAHASGVVVSADGVRLADEDGDVAMARLWRRADRLLRSGTSVTVDACSTQPRRRAAWLDLAQAHGVRSRLVVVEVTGEVAHRRNGARPRAERVPWPSLQRYVREWPAVVAAARLEPWGEVAEGVLRPASSGAW